jgi:hypothetical protein
MKTPCCEKCREYRESPNGGGSYYACVSLNCPCHKDKLTSEDFVKLDKLVDMNIEIMNNHREKGIEGNRGPDDSGIAWREKDWEERFDKEFIKDNGHDTEPSFKDPNGDVGPVKSFIKELLEFTKKEERERLIGLVEGMKRSTHSDKGLIMPVKSYNQALSDVLDLLRKG